MHHVYKLIAICVVFGVVFTNPAPKLTEEILDDLALDSWYNVGDMVEDTIAQETGLVGVAVPRPGLITTIFSCIPKIFAIVAKVFKTALIIIKWLTPKTISLAIGAIATFAFCKLSNLCSVAYSPVMYETIPPQVRDLVTPQVMEDAQQYLVTALQRYAKQ